MTTDKFDMVIMESPEGGTKNLTPEQFRAIPLVQRVDLLCKGRFKFYKHGQLVSPMDAMKVA